MNHVRLLVKSPRFMTGLCILSVILLFVLVYPLFDSGDPMEMLSMGFEAPGTVTYTGKTLVLGSDNFGRDAMLELVYGTRTSLLVGLIAGIITTIVGLSLGLLAGFMGGTVDNLITAVTNMFIVIPSFIILILISMSLDSRSSLTTAFIIGVTGWPWMARAVRGQTSSLLRGDGGDSGHCQQHSSGSQPGHAGAWGAEYGFPGHTDELGAYVFRSGHRRMVDLYTKRCCHISHHVFHVSDEFGDG